MSFPIEPPISPMLSKPRREIPVGEGWLYEPKWDGFRAIVFRDGDQIRLDSRNARPLGRYFPEVLEALAHALPEQCVADGEIIIAGRKGLEFDSLQLRLHPAESRVKLLASQIPAKFVAFDLLADKNDLRQRPLIERRARLRELIDATGDVFLTPQTDDPKIAQQWFERFEGAGLDGIIAKESALEYLPGIRAMVKVKHLRTADCVVAGYRLLRKGEGVGALLLGLYDEGGALHYVGHTSSFKAAERRELVERLAPYEGGESFGEGRTPGAVSRWTRGEEAEWISLRPELVCEVAFDHMQGDRFRHGTTFLRWRPDKQPKECDYDQLEPPHPFKLSDIRKLPV